MIRLMFARPVMRQVPKSDVVPCVREDTTYCVRATVLDTKNGDVDKIYDGYSRDMSIVKKTEKACEARREEGHTCSEVMVSFIKNMNTAESIMVHTKDGSFLLPFNTA